MQLLLVLIAAATLLSAQAQPPQFKFEVASIKPSNAPDQSNRFGRNGQGGLRGEHITTLQLIAFASAVDDTGLSGTFDFKFEWTPDVPPESAGPLLFTAIQEQTGLRLHAKKAPPGIRDWKK